MPAAAAAVLPPPPAATTAVREAEAALLSGELTSEAAILQLQVNDLLAELRPRPLRPQALDEVLQQLRAVLAAAKPHEVPGTLLAGFVRGLGLEPGEVSLAFAPPSAVEAIGSFPLRAQPALARAVLDVALVMPAACLGPKDHVNYRYHARRALFLATVARVLARHAAFREQQLEAAGGDPMRPAVLIRLPELALTLRLLPVPPRGAFALHRLAPDRNNVRWVTRGALVATGFTAPAAAAGRQQLASSVQQQQQQQQNKKKNDKPQARPEDQPTPPTPPPLLLLQQQPPDLQPNSQQAGGGAQRADDWLATPRYNAALLADALALEQAAALAPRLQASAPARDALLLLKAWAEAAGLASGGASSGGVKGEGGNSGVGGLSGHLLAAVLLLAAERAGPGAAAMSALQWFRAALSLLGDAVAWARGLAFARPPAQSAGQQHGQQAPPAMAVFRRAYPAVLLDESGWMNLAAGVTASLLAQAQLVSHRTLAALDAPSDAEAAFTAVFLARVRPAAAFDYLWAVELPPPTDARPGDTCAERREEEAIEALVHKALTTRAVLVRALPRRVAFPELAGAGGVAAALAAGLASPPGRQLLVGAVADAAEALRVVDVGPPADDAPAAARFRALWGECAELRRFQDGRICEAVAWEAPPDERHTIPDAAVAHLLARHLPPGSRVAGGASRLDGALAAHGPGTGRMGAGAAGRAAEAAMTKLARQLRALGEVVLRVVGTQPLSATSRRTAPFVPEPHPLIGGPGGMAAAVEAAALPRVLEPLEVMVQLEGSGRWPDDPMAYAKMKAAVGCQLAGALAASAGFAASPTEEAVDVFVDGFAFRLLLYTDRDAAMHAKAAAAGPHAHHHHAAAHAPPRVLLLSWHHGLVSALEGQHAAFGPACRLAKRWVGAQLMGSQLLPEAVELLVGAAFCGPAILPPPASRMSGLLRFLHLLAGHPWQRAPLLVDPLGELSPSQRRALVAAYEARRAAGSAPPMFIATPRDTATSRWTLERPSPGVLQHLVAAASAASRQLAALQERMPGAGDSWGLLFAAPLSDFDAWALLRRDALPAADRVLPGEAARLAQHLAHHARGGSGDGGSGGGGGARKRVRGDCGAAPAAKSARAVLRAFPRGVLASQPTAALVSELLVGFDPVGRYVALLEERFGHLATFCADAPGGFPAVGVKWLPAAFLPAPLRPALAHCVVEVSPGVALPNLPQALAEMELLGEGLVQGVVAL